MRILAVGGGSGGHVTPVAAVVKELRKSKPDAEIRFWCDRAFLKQATATMHTVDPDMRIDTIVAGKLRRYHKLSIVRQLLQVRTIVLPNLFDAVKIAAGTAQSFVKLLSWRPDVIFTKGGFVCLPVGLAAWALRIPLVIHDSDAHPGLTNRILARFARTIVTGAPLKYYRYPKAKSHYVGIPVAGTISRVNAKQQAEAKKELGFSEHEPLVVITGGGLGASSLNEAAMAVLKDLLQFTSVILISGTAHEAELRARAPKRKNFKLYGYVADDMLTMLGAADIVVRRAGATTLLDLAALGKPAIIVPNAHLSGGHQSKNAAVYEQAGAVVVLDEVQLKAQPLSLVDAINATLLNTAVMKRLSQNIFTLSKPEAARQTANFILKAVGK